MSTATRAGIDGPHELHPPRCHSADGDRLCRAGGVRSGPRRGGPRLGLDGGPVEGGRDRS